MTAVNTKTLKGFKEFLPWEQMAFNKMLDTIRHTYELYGFIPIDTPILERTETLLAKAGGDTEKEIYQFTKGTTNYAMRFDHTVPLARYVAEHERELAFPFRRYTIGKVYRAERPQAGRFREFYQCDIDIVGKDTLPFAADAEIPHIINRVFTQLLPTGTKFTIKINNRKILNGFFNHLKLDQVAAMRILDKIHKIGEEGIAKELATIGASRETIDAIISLSRVTGTNDEILTQLSQLGITDHTFFTGLQELTAVASDDLTQIDLSIARGLDYYTGTVYETTLDEHPEVGSICSGGRYDDLASTYTSAVLPGVGISIGLSRLFDQLQRLELLPKTKSTPTEVLIISEEVTQVASLTEELRQASIATEISEKNLDKALKYANKLGIPYVIIIGEDELKQNKYTLKDMQSGEQQTLDKDALKSILVSRSS
jgi:histidyl-tRNA synthetase